MLLCTNNFLRSSSFVSSLSREYTSSKSSCNIASRNTTSMSPFINIVLFWFLYQYEASEQILWNIKISGEQFLTKCFCDQCEQSELNPLTYQKLFGTFFWLNFFVIIVHKVNKTGCIEKFLCYQCEQSQ